MSPNSWLCWVINLSFIPFGTRKLLPPHSKPSSPSISHLTRSRPSQFKSVCTECLAVFHSTSSAIRSLRWHIFKDTETEKFINPAEGLKSPSSFKIYLTLPISLLTPSPATTPPQTSASTAQSERTQSTHFKHLRPPTLPL